MAAAVFGLIADAEQLSLPVEWVATEEKAKRLSDPLVATLPKKPGPPPVGTIWKRVIVSRPVWRAIAISSAAVWLICRFGTTNQQTRWWYFPLSWLAYLIVSVVRQSRRIKQWTSNYTSNEYQTFPNLNQEKQYQDNALLVQAFQTLDVAKHYAPGAVSFPVSAPSVGETRTGGTGRVFYQPASGYCGYATLNTVIGSISHQKTGDSESLGLLTYPDCLQYISAKGMIKLLTRVSTLTPATSKYSAPWGEVADLTGISYDSFVEHMTVHINDPRFRYMVIFHRSPLFFCHDPAIRKKSVMAVHWSPVCGYLDSADRIVLIDVNASYGPFLVSPKRLYDAVNVRDYIDGSAMGLIRLTVK